MNTSGWPGKGADARIQTAAQYDTLHSPALYPHHFSNPGNNTLGHTSNARAPVDWLIYGNLVDSSALFSTAHVCSDNFITLTTAPLANLSLLPVVHEHES